MRHIRYLPLLSLFLGVLFAGCCLQSGVAHAADQDVSLTANPAIIDVGGETGKEVSFSFQLTNNNDTVLPVHLSTRDSRAREGQADDLMRSLSAKQWISFIEPDFILKANETKQVNARVHIPEDASPGGHYTDILATVLSLEGDSSTVATQPELAVQMLISATGEINEMLDVTTNGPTNMFLNRRIPNTISSFTVTNRGNIHTVFTPVLYLENKKNTIEVKATPEVLLPGESRALVFKVPPTTQLRIYSGQVRFSYGVAQKDATSPEIRIMVLPFDPKLLLIAPCILVGAYAYRIRTRIVHAVKVITKGQTGTRK